jgi:hypothetical protein
MMSMLCNCCVRELLILARTRFAFGLPSKTGCDTWRVKQRDKRQEKVLHSPDERREEWLENKSPGIGLVAVAGDDQDGGRLKQRERAGLG